MLNILHADQSLWTKSKPPKIPIETLLQNTEVLSKEDTNCDLYVGEITLATLALGKFLTRARLTTERLVRTKLGKMKQGISQCYWGWRKRWTWRYVRNRINKVWFKSERVRQQEIYMSHHIKELLKLWVGMGSLKKDVRGEQWARADTGKCCCLRGKERKKNYFPITRNIVSWL